MSPHEHKKYLSDDDFVHVENAWLEMGSRMAMKMEIVMRSFNGIDGWGHNEQGEMKPLCPACYMLSLYNALVMLAQRNGQDMQELKASMAKLFNEMDTAEPYTTVMQVVCPTDNIPNNEQECEKETG